MGLHALSSVFVTLERTLYESKHGPDLSNLVATRDCDRWGDSVGARQTDSSMIRLAHVTTNFSLTLKYETLQNYPVVGS